jgi:hypothetical protein
LLAKPIIFLLCSLPFAAEGAVRERYSGTAVLENGSVAYTEKHEAFFSPERKIRTARTEYFNGKGKKIAELFSDFSHSTLAPVSSFQDFRDGSSHGIDFKEGKYFLWKIEGPSKPREEKALDASEYGTEEPLAGCQGLHYDLDGKLEILRRAGSFTVKYLIPGRLDFYRFELALKKEDDKFLELELKARSFLIRLVSSSMKIRYEKKGLRLAKYEGLSNIPDEK